MTESESVALPLGDAALTERIIADGGGIVKREKQKTFCLSLPFRRFLLYNGDKRGAPLVFRAPERE